MILAHFLLKWADKLFHVETKNNRHIDIQLKDNQKIYSSPQADVIYSKELGLAKTLLKKNKAVKKNALVEYLPHSETKFSLISIAYSFIRSLMFIYKYKITILILHLPFRQHITQLTKLRLPTWFRFKLYS